MALHGMEVTGDTLFLSLPDLFIGHPSLSHIHAITTVILCRPVLLLPSVFPSISPRGVRPRLEGNEWTPLSSRVATGIPWSPRVA